MRKPEPIEEDERHHDRHRSHEAHLGADGGEDHVGGEVRDVARLEVEPEPGAPDTAAAEPELAQPELGTSLVDVRRRRPRVQPLGDPGVHLAEVARRDVRPDGEEHRAEEQVAEAAGRDPQHGDEEGEQEGCEADVTLEADHRHGGAPGHEEGDQRARVEDEPVAQTGRRYGQHLLVLREVRGEEDAQQELRELDRLELQAAEVDPEPGAVDGAEEQRCHQEDARQQEQQVAVALEVPRVLDHEERHDVEHDAECGPGGLLAARASGSSAR